MNPALRVMFPLFIRLSWTQALRINDIPLKSVELCILVVCGVNLSRNARTIKVYF